MVIDNATFLNTLFGDFAPYAHVTAFTYDPGAIPEDRHLAAWAGGYFKDYRFLPNSNQYFTISLFAADDKGKARRRKALYSCTPVIVLDDVREKLDVEKAKLLPPPTWILETSLGSEQWGYKLDTPATDRHRVENLLDGLVANGLAPDGKDPGMKGVTRYVRLPDGYNTKASKSLFGLPFKCRMLEWAPERTTTLEQLAAPFGVNLDAVRREQRVDGASDIPDHPLLGLTDVIHVKEIRSAGRFDVTCPWVHEHTGGIDNGAAVFTNDDGSIGFKCHHGACQSRTGNDLLNLMEATAPGFRTNLTMWKAMRAMATLTSAPGAEVQPTAPASVAPAQEQPAPKPGLPEAPSVSFIGETVPFGRVEMVSFVDDPAEQPPATNLPAPVPIPAQVQQEASALQTMVDLIRRNHPNSQEAKTAAAEVLKVCEDLTTIEQLQWHDQIRDLMGWSKTDFTRVLKGLRNEWYSAGSKEAKQFYQDSMFVKELNQFYNWKTRAFMTVDGFTNANLHEDAEARKGALQDGLVAKVDRLDYAPGKPRTFTEDGVTYGNMYYGDKHPEGTPGDPSPWLKHWDALGWGKYRDHMLKFMAFTILHPERKINHMMILGSREGCGKDFLLYPLMKAMGEDGCVIEGDALIENYTGYLSGVKYLHINETELGDRKEALTIANKLKPIAAAPPETLRVREMYTKPFFIRNLVNGTMTTNSRLPLRLKESRRFFAVWSDLQTRGPNGDMRTEWKDYWEQMWHWMRNGGAEICIWHLRNCVDLSDFKPGAAPPVTEFLREIQEDSKPPVQKTIETFIEAREGLFVSDLLTIKDMMATLKIGEITNPDFMYTDYRSFTTPRVSQTLRDMGFQQVRAQKSKDAARVWIIRNPELYYNLNPADLWDAYAAQMRAAREGVQLQVVSG